MIKGTQKKHRQNHFEFRASREPGLQKPSSSAPLWQHLAYETHQQLGIPGASRALTLDEIQQAFDYVGKRLGVSSALLAYVATVESDGQQVVSAGLPATGLMQIEKSAHPDALRGQLNAANDTIANVAYAGMLLRDTGEQLDNEFLRYHGRRVSDETTRNVLIDLTYNRGQELAEPLARWSDAQGINIDNIQEYAAGRGGKATLVRTERKNYARWDIDIAPEHGSGVDSAGVGSVLHEALAEVDRANPVHLRRRTDVTGDGTFTHFDIWVRRMGTYASLFPSKRLPIG